MTQSHGHRPSHGGHKPPSCHKEEKHHNHCKPRKPKHCQHHHKPQRSKHCR